MSTLDDVFGVARELPESYVVRDNVDGKLVSALSRDQHIVIYGSSKQGKTCLRKYNLQLSEYIVITCSNKWSLAQLHSAILKSAGYIVEGTTTRTLGGGIKLAATLEKSNEVQSSPMKLDPEDVNDIIDALKKAKCPKFIALEDFHYLPEETQRDFAVALKAFHEDSSYSFIVVGVWRDQNRLVQQNGDLTGRVVAIDADRWERDELLRVIQAGERLLSVSFSDKFKNDLLMGCFNSIFVVQESCRFACEEGGIYRKGKSVKRINADASDLIKKAVDAHSARYTGFLTNFALGFQSSSLGMYKWLLWTILNSDVEALERGLQYGDLRAAIDGRHPNAPINAGNLTQALQSTASLQIGKMGIKPIILDYDQTNRRLNVVDRSFLIWLQHQDRRELLALAELPAG